VKVKLLTGLSGPLGSWQPGDIYECDAAEGARLIAAGYAEKVKSRVERATRAAAAELRGG